MKKEKLIKELSKELSANNLAIFAGAGLSAPAGFVNWKGLLKELAEELDLDIDKEYDLVTLAQYYINHKSGNRSKINDIILNSFSQTANTTENHRILARLSIDTFWTTNYDNLIEKALQEAGKIVDVKHTKSQLSTSVRGRDATVYKMHGDANMPTEAVLIKDDYESYHLKRGDFFTALQGDLLTKRFLFLGFSFSDPNIDYILSKIRVSYGENQPGHYCILRKEQPEAGESQADFEYRTRKQALFIQDLKRVGIDTVLIDDYQEITDILLAVEQSQKRKTVFISGAAEDYTPFTQPEVEKFVSELAQGILAQGFRIVTGFGLGIGSSVISGSVEYLLKHRFKIDEDHLILRPFPQNQEGKALWTHLREDMISYAGITIFLFGNKKEIVDGKEQVVLSDGIQEEFDISKRNGNILIPVGATGFMAKKLSNQVDNVSDFLIVDSNLDNLDSIKEEILTVLKNIH